ncbi:DUF3667 domain-containing protein [Lysobacter sp. A421]
MSKSATHHDASHCENCSATLQGEFCHQCGQSSHNPIRHAGHAVEEFFEAFWHLDGRVFRTLRDLMSPGRVAINYLAGHRQRYIAPLRLFVVLSVLAFFIGAATVHIDESTTTTEGVAAIDAATSAAAVERIRDQLVADIEQAREQAGQAIGVDTLLVTAEVRVRAAAANRVVELTGAPVDDAAQALVGIPETAESKPKRVQINLFGHSGEWDAQTNPFVIGWWPDFANRWLNGKIGNIETNMQSMDGATLDVWLQVLMSAAPSALFLLVPVFALMLKLAYLFKRRLYMEHLVVALYSHVFLLIALTLTFVLSSLNSWLAPLASWLGVALGVLFAAVVVWMPIYLLLMQKRVYQQGWWMTLVKYVVIGLIYFVLLMAATMLMFLAQLAHA